MTKYYKKLDEFNNVSRVLSYDFIPHITDLLTVEITKDEYERLLDESYRKCVFVDKVYEGTIAISDIPVDWQEEIQRRVDELITQQGPFDEQELSAEEALNIIVGGESNDA